jgi:hypothetical protein
MTSATNEMSTNALARSRTWSPTFAGSCANPSHSEDVNSSDKRESPARESDPALRLRRPPCARHTRGERAQQCPRQESNLVFDLRRVACDSGTLRGQTVEA